MVVAADDLASAAAVGSLAEEAATSVVVAEDGLRIQDPCHILEVARSHRGREGACLGRGGDLDQALGVGTLDQEVLGLGTLDREALVMGTLDQEALGVGTLG